MSVIVRDIPGNINDPFEVAPPEFEFPFLKNGDSTSFVITRYFKQTIAGYNADRLASKYLPGLAVDREYPQALMLSESKPTRTPSGMCAFQRVFAIIPPDQITYSTTALTKPDPASLVDAYSGFSWMSNPDLDVGYADGDAYVYGGKYFCAGTNKVYSATSIGTPTLTTPSGGTFTVTYNGSTTAALNYNDSGATIAAAVNGLASVISEGLTWSCTPDLTPGICSYRFDCTVGTPAYRISGTNSITPAGAGTFIAIKQTAVRFYLTIAARASLTGHGFDVGDELFVVFNTPACTSYRAGTWSIVNANTIALLSTGYTTITAIGQPLRDYTVGTSRVRTRLTQSFYLPDEEIPLPVSATSDTALLLLAAGTDTGYQVYDATSLAQWKDSPVYTQTITEINVDTL